MSFAAALVLAVSAATPAAAPAPASPPQRGVAATATAQAVILRPATIRFAQMKDGFPSRNDGRKIFRQRSQRGGRILVEFN